ncbi:hypothetical protein [Flavobacterium sp.]|uniref:hypothetical protein n=1 Tax=Flavobacterium sp. TaxID=239 RepID=UPI0025FD033A|nr:hypothetical protein [Flavobacterium sp.]
MKLESLQLDKFQDKALKREQMFMLNGGGIPTGPGNICLQNSSGVWENFDYGYDSDRGGGVLTFHNRTLTKTLCLQ